MWLQRGSCESEEGWIGKAGFRWKSMEDEESEDHRKSIYISTIDLIGTSRRSSSGSSSGGSSGGSGGSSSYEDGDECPWYVITAEDLFTSSSSSSPTEPSPITPAPIPRLPGIECFALVYLYPRIYLIGGRTALPFYEIPQRVSESAAGCRSVYSYDTTGNKGVWQEMKEMESARMSPCAFALDGKIYVFGGLSCSCCDDKEAAGWNCYATKPYLEIYDPATDTWEARLHGACAPLGTLTSRLSALFEDRYGYRHVLFHTDILHLWTYNVDLNLLTCRTKSFFSSYEQPTAVVDGILFSSNESGRVIGYDLTSPDEWCGVVVTGLTVGKEIPYAQDADVSLLGIGQNRLCITYPDEMDHVIFCSVVKVNRTTGGGLHAVVENFKSYSYRGFLGCSMECLAF